MKKLLFLAAAVCSMQWVSAQNKDYRLYVIAEGNFGSGTGDVYRVERTGTAPALVQGPLYQNANNAGGIDVLQDYEPLGNRALLCGKGTTPVKLAITTFPGFDTLKTFTQTTFGAGIQCAGKASTHKAYLSGANGSTFMLDMNSNNLSTVTDPSGALSSYASHMQAAAGYMYIAIGSKIVKVDTLTNAVSGTLTPGIGSIAGMEYDPVQNRIWLLGKVSGTSVLVQMDPGFNDSLHTPVSLSGISNARLLRYGAGKLYFISGTGVYIYDIANPVIPGSPVYTSTLSGSSFSLFYGKSFCVDPVSGDFALASAGNFASPSTYEIVDGSTYVRIDSGSVAGYIANELVLRTGTINSWDTMALPAVYAACDTSVNAPTAQHGDNFITATTSDPLSYSAQGSYSITWTYTDGNDSITQTQHVTIQDTIAPIAALDTLPDLEGNCPYTLSPPTAWDNCSGMISATTDSLIYTQGGLYTIHWTYTDAAGNTQSQNQQLSVICSGTALNSLSLSGIHLYPNPASDQLLIELPKGYQGTYTLTLNNMMGKEYIRSQHSGAKTGLSVAQLPAGIYALQLTDHQSGARFSQKLVISHP